MGHSKNIFPVFESFNLIFVPGILVNKTMDDKIVTITGFFSILTILKV